MLQTSSPGAGRARARAIRVLVADAQPLFRDALARAIARERTLQLAHVTDRITDVEEAVQRHRPDVVVVDRDLVDGELSELATTAGGAASLLLLAADVSPGDVYEALAHGVAGYVSKDATADAVCEAVAAVARGETRLDATAQTVVAGEIRLRARDERPLLSPREQQVLRLIADGHTAPRVAAALHISTATVKTHLIHLYEKLGVAERAAAVAEGMRLGLLE
jgi:two-component system nitrate/nitrite response regulator NarL